MSGFIEWLEGLNEKDTKARAVLRRSLAFEPGTHVPAFPYVEPFVGNGDNARRREALYLVAGLWAAHWREDGRGSRCHWARRVRRIRSQVARRVLSVASLPCWMRIVTSCRIGFAR